MRWVADLTLTMVDKVQLRYWVTNLTLRKLRMANGFFLGQSCRDCIEKREEKSENAKQRTNCIYLNQL